LAWFAKALELAMRHALFQQLALTQTSAALASSAAMAHARGLPVAQAWPAEHIMNVLGQTRAMRDATMSRSRNLVLKRPNTL